MLIGVSYEKKKSKYISSCSRSVNFNTLGIKSIGRPGFKVTAFFDSLQAGQQVKILILHNYNKFTLH